MHVNGTDNRTAHLAVSPKQLSQRTGANWFSLCRSSLGSAVGWCCSGVGSFNSLGVAGVGVAERLQGHLQVGEGVCFVEFEVCSTLQQLANTFRFFHAREFEQDAAGVFELLDIRRNYAESVDTGAKHVVRVVDHSRNLFFEDAFHFVVAHSGLNLFYVAENLIQTAVANLLVFAHECSHKVLFVAVERIGSSDGFVEVGIGILV